VPGFEKREQSSARDKLVDSLLYYNDGWETRAQESSESGGHSMTQVDAEGRSGEGKITLGVYEAYWGDLIPDFSNESPIDRLRRGASLVMYWTFGGLGRLIFKWYLPPRRFPPKTFVALWIAALALLLWYVLVVLVVIQALATEQVELPQIFKNLLEAVGVEEQFDLWLTYIAGLPLVPFLIGVLGLGGPERVAKMASFTKRYLQDTAYDDDPVGIRAKSKQRVLSVLDHIHGLTGADQYDEVYVVAHSMGSAIAIDALSEYGDRLENITLITWGSSLKTLVLQEPLIRQEIKQLYTSPKRLKDWVDVVFTMDAMAAPKPLPNDLHNNIWEVFQADEITPHAFSETVRPKVPRGFGWFSKRIHNGYYVCTSAVTMLLKPNP
jgi:hypothetical protein